MTPSLAADIAAGKAVDADEREIAARALHNVEASDQAAIDDAWDKVVGPRLDELVSGKVQSVSGPETIAIARARSAARAHGPHLAPR